MNAGLILAYLPPYSPDLNPIEEAFAELKAWFKKNYKIAEDMLFDEFMALGLSHVKGNARTHFIRSRIGLPPPQVDEEDYWYD